jgi:hypothetical protein
MELGSPITELFLSNPQHLVGQLHLTWNPQPGNYLDVEGQTYLILERRHRYVLKSGRYHLHRIVLYVQKSLLPSEGGFWEGRWVIGDATCIYNGRSELLRCAVNPNGPCDRCPHYKPQLETQTPSVY